MSNLQELLERVEKAEGGDRAIDTALELLLLSATTKEFPGADPRSGLVLILDAKERWVTCDAADGGEKELQRFIDGNAHRVALDAVDAPTVLLEYAGELRAMQENWPKIKFHALREHAGLVFQKQLEG